MVDDVKKDEATPTPAEAAPQVEDPPVSQDPMGDSILAEMQEQREANIAAEKLEAGEPVEDPPADVIETDPTASEVEFTNEQWLFAASKGWGKNSAAKLQALSDLGILDEVVSRGVPDKPAGEGKPPADGPDSGAGKKLTIDVPEDLNFDEAEFDAPTAKIVKALVQRVLLAEKKLSEQDGSLKETAEWRTKAQERDTVRARREAIHVVDSFFSKIEDADLKKVFGSGSITTMETNSPEVKARLAVVEMSDIIIAGAQARGKDITREQSLADALEMRFARTKGNAAVVKLRTAASNSAAANHLLKPTGRTTIPAGSQNSGKPKPFTQALEDNIKEEMAKQRAKAEAS